MSVKYSLDNLLSKAKSFAKKGNIEEAMRLYQAILSDFPQNVRAQKGLEALQTYSGKSPPKEELFSTRITGLCLIDKNKAVQIPAIPPPITT